MDKNFDRAAEDLGNIIGLEHVNVLIPDMNLATLFYISGLGLTRDPFLLTGVTNMWANVGRSQFHLPVGKAQVLRGRTGLVLPDRAALLQRLDMVKEPLAGTRFAFQAQNDYVETTCPWGNKILCHAPGPRFGNVQLGMGYVEFDVPVGTADGIARFYREILEAVADVADEAGAKVACVSVGHNQVLRFRETSVAQPDFDGHHIQVYIVNFSRPHARLKARGLVTEESNQFQYRFTDIVDPESGRLLFKIEHEVRCMTHPLYARPLVNRNAAQTNNAFAPGHEVQPWALPYAH
jgi:hypothetical protein